jgi:hypothetical protein
VGADDFVHPQQVVEVAVEVVQEDRVQEHPADLGERRAGDAGSLRSRFLGRAQLLARQRGGGPLGADADRQHARRPEPDRGAERGNQPEAAVAEVQVSRRRRDPDGREDDRNRRRRAHVVRRHLDGEDHASLAGPERMAGSPLDEGEGAPGVIAGRRERASA